MGSKLNPTEFIYFPLALAQEKQHSVELQQVKDPSTLVVLGFEWLSTYNPQFNQINYTVQISSGTGSEIYTTSIRPHCLELVVDICSAKVAVHELYRGAVAWFLQL